MYRTPRTYSRTRRIYHRCSKKRIVAADLAIHQHTKDPNRSIATKQTIHKQWHAATIRMICSVAVEIAAFARIPTYRRTDDG
eukprot:scaffold44525_cov53-Attheya_sp.AAC.2